MSTGFKYSYNEQTGHFMANANKYTAKKAAEMALATGMYLEIERLEDIRPGFCSYRIMQGKNGGYTEVEAGTRGSFPIWIIPARYPEE